MSSKIIKGLLIYLVIPIAVVFILSRYVGVIAVDAAIVLWFVLIAYRNIHLFYQQRGNTFYSKGNMQEALKYYYKAYKSRHVKARTKVLYGYLLLKSGQPDKAEDVFNGILASKISDDDRNLTLSNLALLQWKKDRLDEAIATLEQVVAEYKTTTILGSLGYMLIKKGDLDKALKFNLEAYDYNDADPVIMDNLGQTYFLRNELEEANKIYEKLMEKKPAFPEAYYNFGLLMEAINDKEKALELLNKAKSFKLSYISTITEEQINSKINQMQPVIAEGKDEE